MADLVQGLDTSKLIIAETVRFQLICSSWSCQPLRPQVLSFAISPFTSPTYNLPIFLFGLYVQESQEAAARLLQVVSSFSFY